MRHILAHSSPLQTWRLMKKMMNYKNTRDHTPAFAYRDFCDAFARLTPPVLILEISPHNLLPKSFCTPRNPIQFVHFSFSSQKTMCMIKNRNRRFLKHCLFLYIIFYNNMHYIRTTRRNLFYKNIPLSVRQNSGQIF